MTVIGPNNISGINSITAQTNAINFYDSTGATLSIGASVSGNITGNVTGNLVGNVTGNITGNVNSTGISTFTTLRVGSGVTISAGIVSATEFRGSGANLTGISASGTTGNFTVTNGNVVVSSGYGIDFSAASNAAGMTSELLSDYEVGTFTPTITNDGFTRTYNATYTAGKYTKIGNTVHIEVAIYVSGQTGTNNGNFPLINLPFAQSELAPAFRWNHNILRLTYVPNAQIAKLPCVHLTTNNIGYIEMTYQNDGSATSTDSPVNTSTWFGGSGNYQIGFSAVYKTNS